MTQTDEERDKTLKGLSQDGVIAVALNYLNHLIEDNEKEWKEHG